LQEKRRVLPAVEAEIEQVNSGEISGRPQTFGDDSAAVFGAARTRLGVETRPASSIASRLNLEMVDVWETGDVSDAEFETGRSPSHPNLQTLSVNYTKPEIRIMFAINWASIRAKPRRTGDLLPGWSNGFVRHCATSSRV